MLGIHSTLTTLSNGVFLSKHSLFFSAGILFFVSRLEVWLVSERNKEMADEISRSILSIQYAAHEVISTVPHEQRHLALQKIGFN